LSDKKDKKKFLLAEMPIDTFYRLDVLCTRIMQKNKCMKAVSWRQGINRAIDFTYENMRAENGQE